MAAGSQTATMGQATPVYSIAICRGVYNGVENVGKSLPWGSPWPGNCFIAEGTVSGAAANLELLSYPEGLAPPSPGLARASTKVTRKSGYNPGKRYGY